MEVGWFISGCRWRFTSRRKIVDYGKSTYKRLGHKAIRFLTQAGWETQPLWRFIGALVHWFISSLESWVSLWLYPTYGLRLCGAVGNRT